MTATVTTQFRTQFDSSLRVVAQQSESRLMKTALDRGTISGDSFTENRLGSAGDLDENVVRHGDTTWSEIEHSARIVYMRDFFKALPLDVADIPKMIANPVTGGQYMQALIAARNRRIDKMIYEAAGAAIQLKDGSGTVALPSGQKIVAGATGLTKAKIIQAKTMFRAAEADEFAGSELVMLYNSVAMGQLLSDTTLTSGDYMQARMLQDGKLMGSFLGFEWIPYEAISVAGGTYTTFAYAKKSIHFGRGYEIGSVDKRPDKKNSWQVSMAASYGAGREDETKVVQIDFV
jgi:hypothetical protein